MFKDRILIIATRHEKKAIAPLQEIALGLNCLIAENFDTDLLGTFTGEIDRKNDSLSTARSKYLLAMRIPDCDLEIASEGSFGPHLHYSFNEDDQVLLFIDQKKRLKISSKELSTATNFNDEAIKTEKELFDLKKKQSFPLIH